MRKLLLFLFALFAVMQARAYDIEIDGIYYNLNNETMEAEVTYRSGYKYSGSLSIPSSITYSDKSYIVTAIGKTAFSMCTDLTSIVMSNCITSIGTNAFSGCRSLTSIEIPENVTSIGNSAFNFCIVLTSIEIPKSVTCIGNSAFRGCNGLTSISVNSENSVYNSKDDCNAIIETSTNTLIVGCQNTIIPNDVTTINNNAFYNCTGLTSIEIPENVSNIGNYAFYGCTSLSSIEIPESVESIGDGTFQNCSELTSINIPKNVMSIGNSAFCGCNGLTSVSVNSENSVYDSRNDCNAIIETSTNTLIVGCQNTVIPNNVSDIDNYAFYNCTGLTSIEIPESVSNIGNYAFYGCTGLTSIEIPTSANIGEYAFYNCTSLATIDIPNSITCIGNKAFHNTAWYDNQSDGLIYAGLIAYKYKGTMPNNTSIVVDNGTTCILGECFNDCTGLISIEIPNSVTSIGESAFQNCTGLTTVEIPNSVTYIGSSAFSGCSALSSVSISNSITTINSSVFYGCRGLYSITIPKGVTSIGTSAFENCYELWDVTIPEGVTSIGASAFCGCRSISSITIPESVTTIGSKAFYEARFNSIVIPKNVVDIGYAAFSRSDYVPSGHGLEYVISKVKNPCAYYGFFAYVWGSCRLIIPYGTTAVYEEAGWTTATYGGLSVFCGGIEEAPQEDVSVTIGSAGIATYCYDHDLDFSGIEGLNAYIVSGFSPSTGKLTLTPVTEVPAGEGLLLKGAEGSYEVPFTTTDMYYSNLLQGVTTATEISPTDGDQTNFILANGKHGIGFYTLSGTGELAAGKAYLHLPTSAVEAMEARCFTLDFENDEATGIMEHEMKVDEDVYFDMQGRRVLRPSSGIYIVNGKKVIIK